MMADNTSIRRATVADLDALVELEQRGFKADRFSRDQLNYLVTQARATALVLDYDPASPAILHLGQKEIRLKGASFTVLPVELTAK